MSHFQLPQLFLAGIMAMSILVAFLMVPTVTCRIILDTDEKVSLSKEAHAISTNGSQMIIHHHHPQSEEPAAREDQLVDVGISLYVLLEGCKEHAAVHSCMHVSPAIQVAIYSTNTSWSLFTVASKL